MSNVFTPTNLDISNHTKGCPKCGETKSLDEFRPWRQKNRVHSWCKSCTKKAAPSAAYYKRRTCCGEQEIDFLSFDHINNDGAAQRKHIAAGLQLFGYLLKNNPSDIQILCHNCNMARYFYKTCPHQRRPALIMCEEVAA